MNDEINPEVSTGTQENPVETRTEETQTETTVETPVQQ